MDKLKVKDFVGYYNQNGTITYSGFVNGSYVHILSFDKMKVGQAKESLVNRYKQLYNNIEYAKY